MRWIKIFGERHTATNALRALLHENSDSRCIASTSGEIAGKDISRRLEEARKKGVTGEKAIDGIFSPDDERHAWKHCATIFRDVSVFQDALVLISLKHPGSWLCSMFKDPYHLNSASKDIRAFMESVQPSHERERLDCLRLRPLEIYQRKIESYLEFQLQLDEACVEYRFVRSEDMIFCQRAVFDSLAGLLQNPTRSFTEVTTSTKKSDRTLSDYQEYYGKELWKRELEGMENELNEQVDWSLLKPFGYSPLLEGKNAVDRNCMI